MSIQTHGIGFQYNCVKDVPIQLLQSKLPPLVSLPRPITTPASCPLSNALIDFHYEKNIVSSFEKLSQEKDAQEKRRLEARALKEALKRKKMEQEIHKKIEAAKPASAVANFNSTRGSLFPLQPQQSSKKPLKDAASSSSLAPSQTASPLLFSDFEERNDNPFDKSELDSINDIGVLSDLLFSSELTPNPKPTNGLANLTLLETQDISSNLTSRSPIVSPCIQSDTRSPTFQYFPSSSHWKSYENPSPSLISTSPHSPPPPPP
eukprot:Sdes_comp16640_c0_seq1m5940